MAGSAGNFSYTFSAGETQVITVDAEFISCIAATGEFEVVADDVNRMFMKAGISYINRPGNTYKRLRITNKLGAANAITIQFGPGELRDQRLTVSGDVNVVTGPGVALEVAAPAGAPLEVTQADDTLLKHRQPGNIAGTSALVCGAGVNTLAHAANTTYRRVGLSHEGTETMYVTFSSGAANGVPLAPGEKMWLDVTGDVYIINPAAFDQTVKRFVEAW